jgi:hypothetical protein
MKINCGIFCSCHTDPSGTVGASAPEISLDPVE